MRRLGISFVAAFVAALFMWPHVVTAAPGGNGNGGGGGKPPKTTTTTVPTNDSDFRLSVADSPDPVVAGNEVTYRIAWASHAAPVVEEVELRVSVRSAWAVVGSATTNTGTCTAHQTLEGPQLHCLLGTVRYADEGRVTFTVTPLEQPTVAEWDLPAVATLTSDPCPEDVSVEQLFELCTADITIHGDATVSTRVRTNL